MFSMTVFTLYLQIGFTLESLWSDSWTTCNLVLYRKACQPLGPACCTSCPPGSPWAHHWDHGRKRRERGLFGGRELWAFFNWLPHCMDVRMFVSGGKNPSSSYEAVFSWLSLSLGSGNLSPNPSHRSRDNTSCCHEPCGPALFPSVIFFAISM